MRIHTRRLPLAGGILAALAGALLAAGAVLAGGGTATVEAGVFIDFVAPDSSGPTAGSITFGFLGSPEVIAADAELVPPADTNLNFLGGGTPTCIEVTREGGVITRLAFVAECTVTGDVTLVPDVFGPGADGYLIGDRVAAPADLITGDPGYAAMIGVPADAGAVLSITFQVDLATGVPTSFVGMTEVTGAVTLLGNGDILVGAATLPDAVIDSASRAALAEAAALGVEATVQIVGTGFIESKGQPGIEIALSVTYTAPTPVPTPAPTAATTPAPTADALPDTSLASAEPPQRWAGIVLGAFVSAAAGGALATRRRRVG